MTLVKTQEALCFSGVKIRRAAMIPMEARTGNLVRFGLPEMPWSLTVYGRKVNDNAVQ